MVISIFDQSTPKLAAVDLLTNQARSPVTIGNVPPVTIPGASFETSFSPSAMATSNGTSATMGPLCYVVYIFRTTGSGTFSVIPTLSINSGTVSVLGDGLVLGTSTQVGTLPGFAMSVSQAGLHAVMIRAASGSAGIQSIQIK